MGRPVGVGFVQAQAGTEGVEDRGAKTPPVTEDHGMIILQHIENPDQPWYNDPSKKGHSPGKETES